MKIIAIAIEKESSIPWRMKNNPVVIADATNIVAMIDNLLKIEFVNLTLNRIIIIETMRIKKPLLMWARTSNPPV